MSSFKNEILSMSIDSYMSDSFVFSQIKTVCDRKASDSINKLPTNQSCGKSNNSNKSKYSNGGKLTKSHFYETLRRGIKESNFRKEEESDIQINLLGTSLQIQTKQEDELKHSMSALFSQFLQLGQQIASQLQLRSN